MTSGRRRSARLVPCNRASTRKTRGRPRSTRRPRSSRRSLPEHRFPLRNRSGSGRLRFSLPVWRFVFSWQRSSRTPAIGSHVRKAKRPRGFPAGATRTVDFLLYHLSVVVKKVAVKTQHLTRSAEQPFL